MKIKVSNPYWDKVYEVNESYDYFQCSMRNVLVGNEDFIMLTTDKGTLSLSPKNFASIEVIDREDGEDYEFLQHD